MNKLNSFYFIAILIITLSSSAQKKITLIDSNLNEPIPFYSLDYNKQLLYSDKNGVIDFIKYNETGTLHFSMPEFNSKKILIKNIKDTIFLTPAENFLSEIIINTHKKPTIINTKSKKYTAVLLKPGKEIFEKVLFNKNLSGCYIKKISASINRDFITYKNKKVSKSHQIYMRINFYDHNLKKLESTEPFLFTQQKKNSLEITLKNKIEITEEQIYISLEFIGVINTEGNFSNENFHLRPLIFLNKLSTINSQMYLRSNEHNNLISLYPVLNQHFENYNKVKTNNENDTHFFSYEIQ